MLGRDSYGRLDEHIMQKADNWKAPTAGQLRSRINIKIPEGKDSPSKDFSVWAQIVTGGVGQNEITIRWSKELSTQIKKAVSSKFHRVAACMKSRDKRIWTRGIASCDSIARRSSKRNSNRVCSTHSPRKNTSRTYSDMGRDMGLTGCSVHSRLMLPSG